jgi:4-hydroxy-2-oxoheptanedioate aldolase
MATNGFKQGLQTRRMQIGIVAGMSDPYCTDILGGAPFDWVLIDGEHSPSDPNALLRQSQVLAGHRREIAFRPPRYAGESLGLWLDMGIRTLVIPNVESVAEAASLVAATRYPPVGRRGVGPALARAAGWGRQKDYLVGADAQICVIAQIESPEGIASIDGIAATPGIDGILVGPSDLGASLGHPGDSAHPKVVDAIDTALGGALAQGKAAGMFVSDAASAQRYARQGCTFLVIGTDTGLFAKALDERIVAFREALAPARVP